MEPGDETLMLEHPINFVGNETDDLHCFQACIRMACQGLSGESLSLEDADRMTGFEPGRQTWPFVGMLSLAEARYDVRSIEDFNPKHFITDPEAEIRRQAGDAEVGQHIIEVSDLGREVDLVARCLAHPNVTFESRPARLDDLEAAVALPGTAAICNVNYNALADKPGYTGHFVLIESASRDGAMRIQNPGLPPIEDQEVSIDKFLAAWGYGSESMQNALIISR